MSENLDLVRSIYAAWERGDFSFVDWAHPEIEYVVADGPHPGRRTGRAAMTDRMGDFLDAWEQWRVEADEYRELDGERIFVLSHVRGTGQSSGVALQQERAALFHL